MKSATIFTLLFAHIAAIIAEEKLVLRRRQLKAIKDPTATKAPKATNDHSANKALKTPKDV
jgi:hypothetical protein